MTFLTSEGLVDMNKLRRFCESAEVYAVNSSVWLVDSKAEVATHCSDVTYNCSDWNAVYPPTHADYVEFLNDENWSSNHES